MATNMNNLTQEQQAVANQIILTGQQLGVSNTLIEVAVNIANAESAFNFGPQTNTTTANGLFQYTNQSWLESWNRFVAANPNNPLSIKSTSEARFDLNAQIQVGYADIQRFASGFDGNGGGIVRNYMPGGTLSGVTDTLSAVGIDIKTDLLAYEYLRWNTNPDEIINVTNTVFTPVNLAATQRLVSGATTPISTSPITSDGGLTDATSAATQLVQAAYPIPSVQAAPDSTLIPALAKQLEGVPMDGTFQITKETDGTLTMSGSDGTLVKINLDGNGGYYGSVSKPSDNNGSYWQVNFDNGVVQSTLVEVSAKSFL